MNCRQAEEQLQLLLDGLLGPMQVAEVNEHLESCFSCRRGFEALRDLDAGLSAEPAINPPPGMASAIAQTALRNYLLKRHAFVPRWLEALTLGGLTIALLGTAAIVVALGHAAAPVVSHAAGILALLLCGGLAAFGSLYYGAQI